MNPNSLPDHILSWPFFGAGVDSLGVGGRPVREPMPVCTPEQILVRVDALGLCGSDAKMVTMGSDYPLFFARDFAKNPVRLGHEAALTVIEVGARWQKDYAPGQRLGIQPNVYNEGARTIFGVNIEGAMAQYLLLDERVLTGDAGSYVFPAPANLSYADIALLEPWSCVEVSYTPVRRLQPRPDGRMLIIAQPGDERPYNFDFTLSDGSLVLLDPPPAILAWAHRQTVEPVIWPGDTELASAPASGFDDIIVLNPASAQAVSAAARMLAANGVLNLVSEQPLDGPVAIDMGRLHYENLSFVGCTSTAIADAYGRERNRSELRSQGVLLIVGAGGSLGRMHTQRALEMTNGPRVVIAVNRGENRLQALRDDFAALARRNGRELITISPKKEPHRLAQEIDRMTAGRGCDDIVVAAPGAAAITDALPYLAADGLLVAFAGLPIGTEIALPLDRVASHAAQFTGVSGSTVADEIRMAEKASAGLVSPMRAAAAIGGFNALYDGIQAVIARDFPGRIMIYPQLPNLPLLALSDLRFALPDVHARLGSDETWSLAAEQVLLAHALMPELGEMA